ncbi:hypothetical protein EMIT0P43_10325 [Pseudomonas jessenii]
MGAQRAPCQRPRADLDSIGLAQAALSVFMPGDWLNQLSAAVLDPVYIAATGGAIRRCVQKD